MEGTSADGWGAELERWLGPFLARLRRKAQRRWAPAYLRGLILPGERKRRFYSCQTQRACYPLL